MKKAGSNMRAWANWPITCLGSDSRSLGKARIWFDKCRGGMTEVVTVSMACGEYLEDLQLRKGPSAEETAKVRITAHIEKQLGNKRVDRLTLAGLKRWRDGLVITSDDLEMKRASMSSANRTAGVLKAALNHSARLHKIIDRTAWQDLKAFAERSGGAGYLSDSGTDGQPAGSHHR